MAPASAVIRLAQPHDIPALTRLMRDGFVHGFGHLYSGKAMADFLAEHFSPEALQSILQVQADGQGEDALLVADQEGTLLAFAQMGPCKLPVAPERLPALELYRLYTHPSVKGQGLGGKLMEACILRAKSHPYAEWFVGVWSENYGAQRFYQRYGFEKTGEYKFMVGPHADHEWMMACRL